MKQPKKPYSVWFRSEWSSPEDFQVGVWEYLGDTWAVSEAKAVSQVLYRNDVHHYRNRFHEQGCDSMREVRAKAFPVGVNPNKPVLVKPKMQSTVQPKPEYVQLSLFDFIKK